MSTYQKQVRATGQYDNQRMHEIEQGGDEVLSSTVSGSQLHRKVHNPLTEGIEEG